MLRRFMRPHSADGVTRVRGSKRKKGKEGSDVLYKVAVTTGDIKNAGTDAKVRREAPNQNLFVLNDCKFFGVHVRTWPDDFDLPQK